VVYLKRKQLIIKDCARRFVLKLYRHEASRGLFATIELLVILIGTSIPRGRGIKRSTLGVTRSKIKVKRDRNRSQKSIFWDISRTIPAARSPCIRTWRFTQNASMSVRGAHIVEAAGSGLGLHKAIRLLVGCYIWYSEEGTVRGRPGPSLLYQNM